MSYKINYLEEENILETIYAGKIKMLDLISVIQKNVQMAKEHQLNLFLVDCFALIDEKEKVFENYEAGVFMSKFLDQIPRNMCDAIILPENIFARANLHFFETVARNRGMNVRVFETRDEALAWLLSQ